MNFPHYPVQSDLLKEFIDFYYFLETDYESPVKFYAFPHYFKPLNIHRGIDYAITENEIHVHGNQKREPQILLQGVYTEPILVQFSGSVSKLTIIFKDGGLNNFIDSDFGSIAKHHTQLFECWQSKAEYIEFVNTFFNTIDPLEKVRMLEAFLLSILQPKKDWELYQKASVLLKDMDAQLKIAEIAQLLFMSERNLHRLIFKYNGMSPHNFKKIAQFRHSLASKLISDSFKTITDVAYSSNYYDASYFAKIYKSLTLQSPKSFFKNVALHCNNKMVFDWQ